MPDPDHHADPKPSRGMPRSLLYAMIPLGFALLVGFMILSGDADDPPPEQPAGTEAPAD